MSILQYHFRSRILKMNTTITVTIPEPSDHRDAAGNDPG